MLNGRQIKFQPFTIATITSPAGGGRRLRPLTDVVGARLRPLVEAPPGDGEWLQRRQARPRLAILLRPRRQRRRTKPPVLAVGTVGGAGISEALLRLAGRGISGGGARGGPRRRPPEHLPGGGEVARVIVPHHTHLQKNRKNRISSKTHGWKSPRHLGFLGHAETVRIEGNRRNRSRVGLSI